MTRLEGSLNLFLFLALFLMLFAFCTFSSAPAEASAVVGKFTVATGKVDVLKGGSLPATPVKAGDAVEVKDVIRTKSNSQAEVLFNDGNTLKIEQRSRVDISEYVSEDAKGKRVINLPRGKVEATVLPKHAKMIEQSPGTHSFEIHTPNAVAGVRGTTYKVLHINNVTWVFVLEGVVNVYNPKFPDQVQQVPAGFMIMIPPDGPPLPPQPIDPLLMGLDLNNWPGGTETGGTQTDTVVVEPVTTTDNNVPPVYIPPPVGDSFDGDIGFCFDPPCGAFSYFNYSLPLDGGLYPDTESYMTGSLSGSTSFWANPAAFTATGVLYNPNGRTLFGVPLEGSTSDGGAFAGGFGGIAMDGVLEGGMLGMYIKPSGTAGIFQSNDITGTFGSWTASGSITTADMGTTGISPSDLYWGGPAVVTGELTDGFIEGVTYNGTAYMESYQLSDISGWAILFGEIGGNISYPPLAEWKMVLTFSELDVETLISRTDFNVKGSAWADNQLRESVFGYHAGINGEPDTVLIVGEILGTYNATAFQAWIPAIGIETSTFLSMIQTAAGQASLQKLNIPAVEVGRGTLSGTWSDTAYPSDWTITVNMNDTVFFAPSTGQAPAIWATGSVTGDFTDTFGYGFSGTSFTVSGDGLSGGFQINTWDITNARWLANIAGGGNLETMGPGNTQPATFTNHIDFFGAAAGTINGTSGTISGTAAGTSEYVQLP